MSRPHRALFAIYRGDEFVDVGTAQELAERHNMKPKSVRWLSTPGAHKRFGFGGKYVIKVEYDGEEE